MKPVPSLDFFNKFELSQQFPILQSQGYTLFNKQDLPRKDNKVDKRNAISILKCNNIGDTYLHKTISLGLVDERHANKTDILYISKSAETDAVGFIIVEMGECAKKPQVVSIRLICTLLPGLGSTLMAMYLSSIVLFYRKYPRQVEPIGILELANSYINTTGLCLYEKYGFRYDPELVDECYNIYGAKYENLPMSTRRNLPLNDGLDLTSNSAMDKIMKIFSGETPLLKEPICAIRGESQILQGELQDMQRILTYNVGGMFDDAEFLVQHTKGTSRFYYIDLYNILGEDLIKAFQVVTDLDQNTIQQLMAVVRVKPIEKRKTVTKAKSVLGRSLKKVNSTRKLSSTLRRELSASVRPPKRQAGGFKRTKKRNIEKLKNKSIHL
jgi:hypothetical protein